MFLSQIGSIRFPFYSPDDAGGSGGDPGSGAGNAAVGAGQAGQSGGGTPDPANDPIDIDENRLIRVKGSDKPVKFGDHVKGFQSQFTKASQEAARLKTALQEREARIQQYEQERQRSQPGGNQDPQNDVYAQLEQLPYLSGKQAVEVVRNIGEQIKQRDMVQLAVLKKMEQMQRTLGQLNSTHVNAGFDGKISKWLKDGGYPEEASDYMRETYLAYEGDDLDQEFPTIFKNRWEQLNRILEAQRVAKVQKARQMPFVPGRGGAGNPSKPFEMKGNETSAQITEALWNRFSGDDT